LRPKISIREKTNLKKRRDSSASNLAVSLGKEKKRKVKKRTSFTAKNPVGPDSAKNLGLKKSAAFTKSALPKGRRKANTPENCENITQEGRNNFAGPQSASPVESRPRRKGEEKIEEERATYRRQVPQCSEEISIRGPHGRISEKPRPPKISQT